MEKTIIDIAKYCNVSTATVSRVINSPGEVKEETRIKVEKAIPAPSVTQPMILAIIIIGIILVITVVVEYQRKHQICTQKQNDIRG